MNALFVHGMGRSSFSWYPTLRRFRARGIHTTTFAYNVATQNFDAIVLRLVGVLTRLARQGEYVVIGHSLGGVLLRAALQRLPANTVLPTKLFLLGSPVLPARLAIKLRNNLLFRLVTQDCGRLLGSAQRMQQVPAPVIPAIAIIGTRGMHGGWTPFGEETNDGIVTLSEVSADWLTEQIMLPVMHTLLPSSKRVAETMLQRL